MLPFVLNCSLLETRCCLAVTAEGQGRIGGVNGDLGYPAGRGGSFPGHHLKDVIHIVISMATQSLASFP